MDLSSLTGLFVGIHALLAERTKNPELEISDLEGTEFMERAGNVLRHYSVKTTQRVLDWVAFVGWTGAMYVPRIVAIRARTAAERQERASGRVVPMRPGSKPNGTPKTSGKQAVEPPLVIEPNIGDE